MITWAAFHANHQRPSLMHPALTAMLSLFIEKCDTPAMIIHGMNVIKSFTEYLHPGQVPVMACDCPVFAKATFVQWTWPSSHGENGLREKKGVVAHSDESWR